MSLHSGILTTINTLIKENDMTFEFEENEAMFIMQVLGELPTKTGAFHVLAKMDSQFKSQQTPVEEPVAVA